MALILFSVICTFYLTFGFLYMTYNDLSPLGAMGMNGVPTDVLLVFFVGYVSIVIGYVIASKRKAPRLETISKPYFMHFASYVYLMVAAGMFFAGVSFYGGYVGFITTPYSAIIDTSDNEVKDVLISTSGLLSVFSILCAHSGGRQKLVRYTVYSVALFILLSIFIQGRRETTMLFLITIMSYKFMGEGFRFKNIIKSSVIAMVVALFAGLGLYLRASGNTSGGTIFTAINYAVLYETHFTLAPLGNEIRTHFYDGRPYQGVLNLLQPILFVVPSFLFYMVGLDKREALGMISNEPRVYEDKGGSFLFTQAVHSLGYTGVIIDGIAVGFLLAYFYKIARQKNLIFFHFPIVSLIIVAIRKDVTYGIKYISLQFMMLFIIFLLYKLLPKKQGRVK
ncbi:O-antigen polysaccharide polymerase Wzy [Serratia fonticola]|uniref:O-antigen polysaccharide polymerase Wzy n=1 Tax=Serratia fonticola TaxID=47917 RepID=UPI0015C5CEFC|nr:O-antigen polysaccharide polymerase Wzy [Serratia fonticola]NXZ86605.1 O-antigen polysaccharide polymerase Wzy [Serratia fonticola]